MIAQNARSNHPDCITSFGTLVYPSEALERATAVVSFLDVALQALLSKGAPEEPGDEQVFGLGLIFSETLSTMRAAKAAMQAPKVSDNNTASGGARPPSAQEVADLVTEAFRKAGQTYPRFDSGTASEDVPPRAAER